MYQIDNVAKINLCHIIDYYDAKSYPLKPKGLKKIAIASSIS